MKFAILIILTPVLAGCSCAIHRMRYSPVGTQPNGQQFDKIAKGAGCDRAQEESGIISYHAEGLGMHYVPETGALDFTNSHCPVLPFWTHPGKAYEKRWQDSIPVLKALDENGFPYRERNSNAEADRLEIER